MARDTNVLTELSKPTSQPNLGTGMAQKAATAMQQEAYRRHLAEAQSLGETPMTYNEFMQEQMANRNRQ